ncbi:hypothetical protein LCGC14_0208410 [marine sediment metagenome]|uniref:Uncharacterized protein n=1 Tax=marine sediment metagenome TaxID=412755 RepID=A0A0F9UGL6_9ZZZZ
MGIALSIEIYEDYGGPYEGKAGQFHWVFLDSSGQTHGPSIGFNSRWEAVADIERILATSIDKEEDNGR